MSKTKKNISVDDMLIHFDAYEKEVKAAPFVVTDWVGKDAEEVDRKKEKPLTMEGFENYLAKNKILQDICDYVNNRDNAYADYIDVIRYIKRRIRQDQIEGGMAQIYNSSITARLQGLKEHIESNNSVSILTIDPLDDSANNSASKDSKAP